jgi:hemoglobin/transferrin/lactoferrin receptor protein
MLKHAGLIWIVILLGNGIIQAQEDSTVKPLDEVILTGLRKQQKNLLSPWSAERLSRNVLNQYQPRTTPEALIGTTGVFVQKTNHGGGSPFIRGLTGNQVLMLVDGIRLNNSTFRYGPNQYLNTIDPFSIQSIEVVKGTGSVQYGSDAMGGVIQLFSKTPRFSDTGNRISGLGFAKYMSGDMEKTLRGEVDYSGAKFAAHAGLTYRKFGDLKGGDSTGFQRPSGYDEMAADAKLKFLLAPDIQLTIAHQFNRQNEVPVYHKVVLENFAVNEMYLQQRMLNYAKLNIGTKQKWISAIEIIGSWNNTQEERRSRKNGSDVLRKEKDIVNTLGLTADISSEFNRIWTANSGIEIYHDNVGSTRNDITLSNQNKKQLRGLYPDGSKFGNYSLYSLHHFNWQKFSIEAGLRYNSFSISINDTATGPVKITPSSLVYNAAFMYHLNEYHHIYAGLHSGFRAPNIDDLGTLGIVDFRYEVPVPELKPEKSRTTEIGYKMQQGKWNAAISFYYMDISNLITRVKVEGEVINGYPVYKKQNTDKGYIKGSEISAGYMINRWFSLSGNLALQYGQSITAAEPLRRIPPVHGRVLATYRKKSWFAATEFLFAGKQNRLAKGDKEDNRIPTGGTPGWQVLNMYAGYEWKILQFNAGLQNLFDEDYRMHGSGINGVGRSVWLGVMVKW